MTDELKQEGFNWAVVDATLDADLAGRHNDLYLSLVCLDSLKTVYIWTYDVVVPDDVDAYIVGIWDDSIGEWIDGATHGYYNPTITDDGSGIYIFNQTQTRQILDVIKKADQQRNHPSRAMTVILYSSGDKQGTRLGSSFDPTGWQDAIAYLPCY